MTEPQQVPHEPTWEVLAIDYDRRNVEWVLWALTDGQETFSGRVVANGGEFFIGDFDRARDLWGAFASQ